MTIAVTPKLAGFIPVIFVVAVALLFSGSARAEDDHLIVPWQRIGPVTLTMTADDVVRVLGEPTQKNRGPNVTVYRWKDDLSVTARTSDSSVTQICALSPDYKTAQGLHPGLSDASLAVLMGEPQNSRVYHGWWKLSYVKMFWGGLMVSVPLTGFANDHAVQSVCVNHNA